MPLGSLWTWEGLKDQLLENALLWKRVNKGPLGPSCCLQPFDATEDAGSRQRPGWGGEQSTGPGNGLQTSSSSQTGSTAYLLGACLGSLTPFSLDQEWPSCCPRLTGSACGERDGEGDEGSQAFAAEPLSKLTLWSSDAQDWRGADMPCLTCRGDATSLQGAQMDNPLPRISQEWFALDRRERWSIAFEKQQYPLSQTTRLFLFCSDCLD